MENKPQTEISAAVPGMPTPPPPPKPVLYYALKDGTQTGPYDVTKLKELIAAGELANDVLLWTEGMAEWKAYHQVFAEGEESSQKPLDTGVSFLKKLGSSALDAAQKGADMVREHDWKATLQKTNETLKEYGDKADHVAGQYLGCKKKNTLKIARLVGACVVILLAAIVVKGVLASNNDWRDNISPEAEREYQLAKECNNSQERIILYRRAAEKGYAPAIWSLARCYSNGDGVKKNEGEAIKLWKEAADMGLDAACDSLISYYKYNKEDEKELSKWYRRKIDCNMKLAKDGDADAQYAIASVYHLGTREVKDAKEAAKWYKKAAEQGHRLSQLALAECYHNGEGVKKDMKKAVNWYKKGLDGRDIRDWGYFEAEAAYHLGVCYYEGLGVEKNEEEGINLLLIVANLPYDFLINVYIQKARSYLREHGVEILD